MRPAFQGGKTAGIKTTLFIYSENFQSKELYLASLFSCGCPHFSLGKQCPSPPSAAGGGRFLLNHIIRSPTTTAYSTRIFVRVSLAGPQDCHSDYSVFTVDFCLLALTVKAWFQGKGKPRKPWWSSKDSPWSIFITIISQITCLSRPVTSLQMKPWWWTKGPVIFGWGALLTAWLYMPLLCPITAFADLGAGPVFSCWSCSDRHWSKMKAANLHYDKSK